MKAMLASKLKAVAGVLVLVAGIGLGTAATTWQYGLAARGAAPAGADAEGKGVAAPEKKAEATPSGASYSYFSGVYQFATAPEKKAEAKPRAYVIEPPDILLVKYAPRGSDDPVKIAGQRPVRPDGTIGLGQLGSVFVSGRTVEEARGAIAKHLASRLDGFDPEKLTVDVAAYRSKRVYLIYEGASGGSYLYTLPAIGGKTVLDAIVEAKVTLIGLGRKRVCVQRMSDDGKGSQVLPVDWEAITQRGDTATNYELRPGDRVQIKGPAPQKAEGARRTDAVKVAGSDPVRELETVVKALREARSQEERRRAVEGLDLLTKKLREQLKKPGGANRP